MGSINDRANLEQKYSISNSINNLFLYFVKCKTCWKCSTSQLRRGRRGKRVF